MNYILFATYKYANASLAADHLRVSGHHVIVVDDGEQAMEMIASAGKLPLVLFAHHIMPNMDGMELFYSFRQQFPTFQTKLMLGLPMPSNGEPWREWDGRVDSYIMLPYSDWQLVLSTEQLLFLRDNT
ncbi:MAG: hypothetical protein H7145_04610 [Akkermansiaceae bacterium]|nr:hypothetical protein [Armatimonadota bacterium]